METGKQNQKQSNESSNKFSFFDAPHPRYNKELFIMDPAIIGRNLPRPGRPIGQISEKYSKKPVKFLTPCECEVSSPRRLNLFVWIKLNFIKIYKNFII